MFRGSAYGRYDQGTIVIHALAGKWRDDRIDGISGVDFFDGGRVMTG